MGDYSCLAVQQRVISMRSMLVLPLCLLASAATAMHLAPSGMGQVLISPYYTVNAGHQTLVTVTNHSDAGKALKLRFLEGRNGREVFALNLYLAPHDLWTAALFATEESGAAKLVTPDDSCTVPAIKTSATLPQLANGRRYATFSNQDYTGTRDDVGPDALTRTREGYFEIIEMGEVINAAQRSLNDISPGSDGIPANCARVEAAWAGGGYWSANAGIDLMRPRGDVSATASLVNTDGGVMYSIAAEAIDGFSSIVQHTAPTSALPNLASGVGDLAEGFIESTFELDGTRHTGRYPADRAIDAVSALLMAERIDNEFNARPTAGAASLWVVTAPTKKFYADDAMVGVAVIPPFTARFSQYGNDADFPPLPPGQFESCSPHDPGQGERMYVTVLQSRDAQPPRINCSTDLPYISPFDLLFGPRAPTLAWATSVLTLGGAANLPSRGFGSRLSRHGHIEEFGLADGWMSLALVHPGGGTDLPPVGPPLQRLRPDQSGLRLRGLPLIGFWAVTFTNNAITPGVIAHYASTRRHRFQRVAEVAP